MPATSIQNEESVPSVFDEDEDSLREQRQRELRRIRSVLISSGFLILLPGIIGRIRNGGFESLSDAFFAAYCVAVLAVYFLLGTFATRQPFTALIIGVIGYVLLQGWIIWSSPSALYAGWLFRILVLLNLCMPLVRAKKLQHL
jgi:Flp pilus assembly protein TadB